MKIGNGLIYILIIAALLTVFGYRKGKVHGRAAECLHRYAYLIGVCFAANTLSLILAYGTQTTGIRVERADYGEEDREVQLQLRDGETTEDMILTVTPRQYSDRELSERFDGAFAYLDEHLRGENASLDEVRTDLSMDLGEEYTDLGVTLSPEHYALIDEEGVVRNEKEALLAAGFSVQEIEGGILSSVKITLACGAESREKTYSVRVFAREQTGQEQLFAKVKEKLNSLQEQDEQSAYIELPNRLYDVEIANKDKAAASPVTVLLFGALVSVLLVFRDKERERQVSRVRAQSLLHCYPWFVNEMVLMLGAGMQVKHIFTQMLTDYERERIADEREPLICELATAKKQFELGMPEGQIYYQLGRRLKLSCYIKLMTLLEQNVVKGAKGMLDVFEQEEQNALEERKNLAKRYGEEAGTKLLGPMILLLIIIMLMIMVPAFLSF